MATRTSYIVQDALEIVKDGALRSHTRSEAVRKLDAVQKRLCREAMALKFEGTLALTVGQEVYDVNGDVESIVEVIEPAAWTVPLTVLQDITKWREVRRDTTLSGTQPLYGFLWDRFMHLWPPPSVAAETLVIYGKGLPLNVLTEAADPEVNERWDDAMLYALVDDFERGKKNGEGISYKAMYEAERDTVAGREMKESIKGAITRRHWTDELNF